MNAYLYKQMKMISNVPVLLVIVFSIKVDGQIKMSSDLNCDFFAPCRWRNASTNDDDGDFFLAHNIRNENGYNIFANRHDLGEIFAYTHGPFDGIQKAILISDLISCQLGGGTLTFWYYRTGAQANLEVCIRQPPSSVITADLKCFPIFVKNHEHQWIFSATEFPPLTQTFEILIRSTFIQPHDIIAIDNIRYDAILCENVNTRSTEGAGGKFSSIDELIEDEYAKRMPNIPEVMPPDNTVLSMLPDGHNQSFLSLRAAPTAHRSGQQDGTGDQTAVESHCQLIDCKFDGGVMCHYSTDDRLKDDDDDLLLGLTQASNLKQWKLSRRQVGNSLTGVMHDIDGDGWFAYADDTDDPNAIFLLYTTDVVNISAESRLDFHYHLAGRHGRLRVCVDSIQRCLIERTGLELNPASRQWIHLFAILPPGFHRLYFVADNLRKNYVIALDNIQLLNKDGTQTSVCTR